MSAHSMAAGLDKPTRILRALVAGVVVVVLFDSVQAADFAIVVKDRAGNRLQDAVILAESVDMPSDGASVEESNPPAVKNHQNNMHFEP